MILNWLYIPKNYTLTKENIEYDVKKFTLTQFGYTLYKKYYLIIIGGVFHISGYYRRISTNNIYIVDLFNWTFIRSHIRSPNMIRIEDNKSGIKLNGIHDPFVLLCNRKNENKNKNLNKNDKYETDLHIFGGTSCVQQNYHNNEKQGRMHFKINLSMIIKQLTINSVVIPWMNVIQRKLSIDIPNDVRLLIEKYSIL